jgi:hypothetical protein
MVFRTGRGYRHSRKEREAREARLAVAVHSGAQSRRQEVKIYETYIKYITSICVSYK